MTGAEESYCAYCGVDLDGGALRRFGARFCTEEHAGLYGQELRARQMAVAPREEKVTPTEQMAVAAEEGAPEAAGGPAREPATGAAQGDACAPKKGLKGWLLKAACCGGGLLILAMLPLVAPAVGAIGSSLLTILALAACPLGMYLMMRMMGRQMQHREQAGPTAAVDRLPGETGRARDGALATEAGAGAAPVASGAANPGSDREGQPLVGRG